MEESFSLEIFEGPLAFLLHLIQKCEIDIHRVPIHEITGQYLERMQTSSVDTGAEFIGAASLLMWLKSKRLLPKHEANDEETAELEANFEIIYKLLEYCRFKEAAKELSIREESQSAFFIRGVNSLPEPVKQTGIEHLTAEDLSNHFRQVLNRAAESKGKIHEEIWKVSDKIIHIRSLLKAEKKLLFSSIYTPEKSKGELIVIFLAMLELMKIGDCFVGKELNSGQIYIFEGLYDTGIDGTSTGG